MALSIDVPDLYPLTFAIIAFYTLFLLWCGVQVSSARKKFGVKLPAAYENKDDSVFNRYQRVHQNAVEGVASFYACLLLSALTTPVASLVCGVIFVIGRIVYARGYYASPESRRRGAFYFPAFLYLVGGSFYSAFALTAGK